MRTLYLDIFSGISGDMFIGALIDLGIDAHRLEEELRKLRLGGYHVHVSRGQKSSISGTKFNVHLTDELHLEEGEHEHAHHHHGHAHAHHHHENESHDHPHEHHL